MHSANKTCTLFTLRHRIPHLFVNIFGIGTDLEENTKTALS